MQWYTTTVTVLPLMNAESRHASFVVTHSSELIISEFCRFMVAKEQTKQYKCPPFYQAVPGFLCALSLQG